MKIWKYSGILLIATGVIHTIVSILFGKDVHMEMIKEGLWNSLNGDFAREFAFWFFICGILVIILGYLAHTFIIQAQKPLPVSFGYTILALSIFGCIVVPVSGFWLFIPQALIIIFAKNNTTE